MVLDNLGNSLKNTLSKISKALFVDEKLINELVKDIQKALLQSDVNVKLVLEMSKRIKEKALKTEAPGTISKKEWLIKIVYDELVTFLGEEEYNIDITKKPSKIMLVGLFGNGKCVHKDSLILLSNGRNITAEKLYEKYQHNEEYKLKDGYIIPLKNELYMPSFNTKTLKIENRKASYLWKLKSKKLMQINLDNGNDFDVKTTYEHPFFILDNGNIIQKRADELKKNDYVAIPTNFTPEINNKNLKNKIKKLNFDTYVKEKEKIERIKEQLKLKYGSLKKAVKELPYKRNYAKFTLLMKKGQVPVFFYDFCNEKTIILKENKGCGSG